MKQLTFALILGTVLATNAVARDLPAYYPEDQLGRSGEIDAIYLDENRVIIDDVPYEISGDVVVHSLTAYSVSRTRLRPGTRVAFKAGSNRLITTFWLLPRGYEPRGRR